MSKLVMASPSNKVKICLEGVSETALYTLWIKAQDALNPKSKLHDKWAAEIVDRVEDYDFSKFNIDTATAQAMPLRTLTFDKWTKSFLKEHPKATIINLACGLESRALRLLPSYDKVRWMDVDLPDIVTLRQQLLPSPKGDYKLVAASIAEEGWLSAIPRDRPTLIIAEGLLMYLPQKLVDGLIRRLVGYFESGQLIFDVVGTYTLRIQSILVVLNVTGILFASAMDNFYAIEKLDPRIKFSQASRYADYEGFDTLPFRLRFIFRLLKYTPWFRNIQVNLRYQFGSVP